MNRVGSPFFQRLREAVGGITSKNEKWIALVGGLSVNVSGSADRREEHACC
jgi:hypothetical protein